MDQDKRTGKMTKAGSVVPEVMLGVWNMVVRGFSNKTLEEFSLTEDWPFDELARRELARRSTNASKN